MNFFLNSWRWRSGPESGKSLCHMADAPLSSRLVRRKLIRKHSLSSLSLSRSLLEAGIYNQPCSESQHDKKCSLNGQTFFRTNSLACGRELRLQPPKGRRYLHCHRPTGPSLAHRSGIVGHIGLRGCGSIAQTTRAAHVPRGCPIVYYCSPLLPGVQCEIKA